MAYGRTTDKVTLSLPHTLMERIERLRAQHGESRSQLIAAMLTAQLRALEDAERETRHAAAYRRQPETPDEREPALAAAAEAWAHAGDEWVDESPRSRGNSRSTRSTEPEPGTSTRAAKHRAAR